MPSIWERKNQIIDSNYLDNFNFRITQAPTVLKLNNEKIRLLFGGRDQNNKSQLMGIDLDPQHEMKIIKFIENPLIELGGNGEFDCDGIMPSTIVQNESDTLLFYTAIKLNGLPQYDTSIGSATLQQDNTHFVRKLKGPTLSKGPFDPFGVMTPCILKHQNEYLLWYSSTTHWRHAQKPHPDHSYNIRFARSKDLTHWEFSPEPAINFKNDKETGLIKPWVQQAHPGLYEMWYSFRGPYDLDKPELRKYKIGYATSTNKLEWSRKDDEHTWLNPPQKHDWDHDMQCYQTVVTINDKQYMFYCGNGYGQGGIGYAERLIS